MTRIPGLTRFRNSFVQSHFHRVLSLVSQIDPDPGIQYRTPADQLPDQVPERQGLGQYLSEQSQVHDRSRGTDLEPEILQPLLPAGPVDEPGRLLEREKTLRRLENIRIDSGISEVSPGRSPPLSGETPRTERA
jgi:hypothetical protein